jgi:hypothetical protein
MEEWKPAWSDGGGEAAAGSGGSVEEREPDRGKGARGEKRSLGLKCLVAALLVIVLLCLVQAFGSFRVNPVMKRYEARAEKIRAKIERTVDAGTTLLSVLTDLGEAEKDNRKLKGEVERYLARNKWVLIKDTTALGVLEANEELLSELTSKSSELLSAIQRNQEIDREIEELLQAETASWASVSSRIEELVEECSGLRSEVAGIVVAKELRHYHQAFVGALAEKEQFLRCFGDAVNSAFQADYSYSVALETYAGAYFIWEYLEAARYAAESERWLDQAVSQVEEAKSHWDEYLRLIALVCEAPEELDL